MRLMNAIAVVPLMLALSARAQGVPPSVVFDPKAMSATMDAVLAEAKKAPHGIAFRILATQPGGNEQLAIRTQSGQGEWHRDYVDAMFILEGNAQLVTGGTIVNGKGSDDEVRGDGVKGGKTQDLHPGDMVRIEAKTPHQFLLAPGATIKYFTVKIKVAN